MTGVINPPSSPISSGNITIKDVFDYVMTSPENTNPNVLKSMLIEMSNGGFSNNDNTFLNALVVRIGGSQDSPIADATFNEIDQAYKGEYYVVVKLSNNYYPIKYDGVVYYAELTQNGTLYAFQFYPNGNITFGEKIVSET